MALPSVMKQLMKYTFATVRHEQEYCPFCIEVKETKPACCIFKKMTKPVASFGVYLFFYIYLIYFLLLGTIEKKNC